MAKSYSMLSLMCVWERERSHRTWMLLEGVIDPCLQYDQYNWSCLLQRSNNSGQHDSVWMALNSKKMLFQTTKKRLIDEHAFAALSADKNSSPNEQ